MRFSVVVTIISTVFIISISLNYAYRAERHWEYQFVQINEYPDPNAYTISRIDTVTDVQETLITLSHETDFNFAHLIPENELMLTEIWAEPNTQAQLASEDYFRISLSQAFWRLIDIAPAPDDRSIAIATEYKRCFIHPRSECFGVAQIELLNLATEQRELIWSLSLQADTDVFPFCRHDYFSSEMMERTILDIQWMPTGDSLVASLGGYHYDVQATSLIIIPTDTPQDALLLGEGSYDWEVSPDGQTLVTISPPCPREQSTQDRVLTVYDMADPTITAQVRFNAFIGIPVNTGIAFLEGNVLFQYEEHPFYQRTPPCDCAGVYGHLAVFDPLHSTTTLYDFPPNRLTSIQSDSRGTTVIAYDETGSRLDY
ncbi:MAG: hypothetical protein AAFV98_04750 [Chloroflexota bacterium]